MEKLEKHKQQVQANRQQMLQNKAKEKLDRVRSHLSKSEKITFQRTISSYGIMNKNEDGTRDWSNFKRLSNLDKTDECMENYFEELMDICHAVIKREEEKKKGEKSEEGQTPASEGEDKKSGDKHENFTIEKAKRLIRRIDLLKKLREVILKKDDLDELLMFAKKPARSGLPNWWICGTHDKALLQSIAEYGILRPDLTISDPKYPFKELIEKAREEEQKEAVIDMNDKKDGTTNNNENSSSVQSSSTRYISSNATQMEKDWMKEMVIVRRFESLCDMVLNEKKVSRLKRMRSNVSKKSETESVNGDERPNKKTKYNIKFHVSSSKDGSPSKDKSKKHKSKSKKRRHGKKNPELDREVKKIIRNYKRKALTGLDSDSSLESDSDLSDTVKKISKKHHHKHKHSHHYKSSSDLDSSLSDSMSSISSDSDASPPLPPQYNSDSDSGMDTDEMLIRAEKNLVNNINNDGDNSSSSSSSNGVPSIKEFKSSKQKKKRIKLFRTSSPKVKITNNQIKKASSSSKSNNTQSSKDSNSQHTKTSIKIRTTDATHTSNTNNAIKLPKIKFKTIATSSVTTPNDSKTKTTNDVAPKSTTPPPGTNSIVSKKKIFLQDYPPSSSSSESESASESESENESDSNNEDNNSGDGNESSSSSESDVWLGTKRK